ncbi:MAG: hypothetical protein N3G21_00635 [Candidatus Hydrogenedentes bacterium]|nr:hypothetical protein [Candidatus Hydrogenedentota bacterium]
MSEPSSVICPACHNNFAISLFGRTDELICPACGKLITIKKDTEVLVRMGDKTKQKLSFDFELENSPVLISKVKSDLASRGEMDLLEKFYAIEELINYYLESNAMREEDKVALAVIASKMQIELGPAVKDYLNKRGGGLPLPVHLGYAVLSEIKERQGLYEEAINLCQRAYSEGWSGDWLDRIHRCRKTSFFQKD